MEEGYFTVFGGNRTSFPLKEKSILLTHYAPWEVSQKEKSPALTKIFESSLQFISRFTRRVQLFLRIELLVIQAVDGSISPYTCNDI